MDNQQPEDLIQLLGSFKFAGPGSQPDPSCGVEHSTPTPVVDQKEAQDYWPRSILSKCKKCLSSSEPQYDSPAQQPQNEWVQGQPSPKAGHYLPTTNQKRPTHLPLNEEEQGLPYGPLTGNQALPDGCYNGPHYQPQQHQQLMTSQHHRGCCAHCNGEAQYHEDDWYYPCGHVKKLTSQHLISEDMLRVYGFKQGEVFFEVILPPPIPIFTSVPRPTTDYARESSLSYGELVKVNNVDEPLYLNGPSATSTTTTATAHPFSTPASTLPATSAQVPETNQPPSKPKQTMNPETFEKPTGFTMFRDQNWFKFKKKLGTKNTNVIADALREQWWTMAPADNFKYEQQAQKARYIVSQIHPELCLPSPPMNQETCLKRLPKHKRRKLEKRWGIYTKKRKQKKEKKKKEKKTKVSCLL